MLQLIKRAYDATWGKYVFAGMYDRFLDKFEKAGLSQKRKEMLAPARGRTIGGPGDRGRWRWRSGTGSSAREPRGCGSFGESSPTAHEANI